MTSIQSYRKKIDELDAEILELIAQRFDITEELGVMKISQGMDAYQKDRWQEVIDNVLEVSKEVGLAKDMVIPMWDKIHEYSIIQQDKIKEFLRKQRQRASQDPT